MSRRESARMVGIERASSARVFFRGVAEVNSSCYPAWVSENALGTGRESRCRDTSGTAAHDIVSVCGAHSTRCYQWGRKIIRA
jgi:hypothetical protein